MSALPAAARSKPDTAVAAGSSLLAREQLLPVTEALSELLPLGGLQRGTTTVIGRGPAGATSLALELLTGASRAGHWCAAVGLPDLGLVAASERGIALERLLLVPSPGPSPRWQQVLATLFEGVAAVLFTPGRPVRPSEGRKVAARAREKGAVLLVLDKRGHWPEPADLRFEVVSSRWRGLGEGWGLLAERSLEVGLRGRGAAARPRSGSLFSSPAEKPPLVPLEARAR